MKLRKLIQEEIKKLLAESGQDNVVDFLETGHPIVKREFQPPTINEEGEFAGMTYEELVRTAGVTLEMAIKNRWERYALIRAIREWEDK